MREMFLLFLFGGPVVMLAAGGLVTLMVLRDEKVMDRLDAERAREARAPAE